MWVGLLDRFLNALFRHGTLRVTYADGQTRQYGHGQPECAVTFHSADLPRRLVLSPDVVVGEAYMDGELTILDDDLEGFLDLAVRNLAALESRWMLMPKRIWHRAVRRVQQISPIQRAQKNVAHHYDLSGALYDLFLDADRQYSCGYFTEPDMTLEAAQAAKKDYIARKLLIQPGMRVLDIGCGWGGMGLTLARDFGAQVLGVTLSQEQHRAAQARAAEAGLADRVTFKLMDYREVTGQFDRIVSVGMFEHVGLPQYRRFFDHLRGLLTADGVALVHTVGRSGPPGITSPWIQKYIFPGGYVPALSETSAAIERAGLYVDDVEVWRLHYAKTLAHWHARFMRQIDTARALYDERFCRMWRYYLLGCEKTFIHEKQVVFQFLLSRHKAAVPITRDYLYARRDETV